MQNRESIRIKQRLCLLMNIAECSSRVTAAHAVLAEPCLLHGCGPCHSAESSLKENRFGWQYTVLQCIGCCRRHHEVMI